MKTLMRTLTLSAAALAALVAAPTSNAQEFRRGGAHETFRGNPGRGNPGYGNPGYGNHGDRNRGYGNRGYGNRGYGNPGYGWHNRGFVRPPSYSYSYGYGRRYVSPFRVYAGSRFYSYCPGPGYIYVDDLGWVFPPFPGARWFPAHVDRFGVRIGARWR